MNFKKSSYVRDKVTDLKGAANKDLEKRLRLKDFSPNTLIKVTTKNNIYYIVVVDGPESLVVVLGGRIFIWPQVCYLQGSVFGRGGTMLVTGTLALELHAEFVDLAKTKITTPRVRDIEILDNPKFAKELIGLAKLRLEEIAIPEILK